jgi:hypothetical protein
MKRTRSIARCLNGVARIMTTFTRAVIWQQRGSVYEVLSPAAKLRISKKDLRSSGLSASRKNSPAYEEAEIREYLSSLPSAEPWLRKNSVARASVERGLQQAAAGEVHYLGSFAEYADLDIDD